MDYQWIFNAITNHGLAVVLVIVFVIYGRKFINGVMDRYVKELDKKDATINNHLNHVEIAVNNQNIQLATQKETLDNGFNRVVDAINAQTQYIVKKDEKENE